MKALQNVVVSLGLTLCTAMIACAETLAPPTNLRLASEHDPAYLHGQEIGAQNTGWRGLGLSVDDLVPHSGVFTEPGVYEGLDINGSIRIQSDNVTVRGFRVRYSGNTYAVQYYPTTKSGFKNAILEYGEIVGTGTSDGNTGSIGILLHGPSQTTRRLHIRGFRVGMHLYGNDVVENNYVEKLAYSPGSHNTSWSIRGSNVVVRGNHLTDGNSAAMSIYPDSPITNLDIIDNFWQTPTGNYCVYFGLTGSGAKAGAASSSHFRVINNVWGQDWSPVCGSSGPYHGWTNNRSGNEWSDNRYADGTPLK